MRVMHCEGGSVSCACRHQTEPLIRWSDQDRKDDRDHSIGGGDVVQFCFVPAVVLEHVPAKWNSGSPQDMRPTQKPGRLPDSIEAGNALA